jgi:hypothetical protein
MGRRKDEEGKSSEERAEKLVALVRRGTDGLPRLTAYLRSGRRTRRRGAPPAAKLDADNIDDGDDDDWINDATQAGLTALHWACRIDVAEIVTVLIEYGADPLVEDAFGSTPAHHAALTGSRRALEQLLTEVALLGDNNQQGTQQPGISQQGISQQRREMEADAPRRARSYKVSVEAIYRTGVSGELRALTSEERDLAAAHSGNDLLQLVLNAANAHGETPLHCALASAHRPCAACLVEWGASAENITAYGCGALDLADAVSRGAVLLAMAGRAGEFAEHDAAETAAAQGGDGGGGGGGGGSSNGLSKVIYT